METVDLQDELGKTVVRLSVVRNAFWKNGKPACPHMSISVDTALALVHCLDCNEKLCAVEWIARMAERWAVVKHQYNREREMMRRLHEVERRLQAKARAKCEHCHRVTRIHWPSLSAMAMARAYPFAANEP